MIATALWIASGYILLGLFLLGVLEAIFSERPQWDVALVLVLVWPLCLCILLFRIGMWAWQLIEVLLGRRGM